MLKTADIVVAVAVTAGQWSASAFRLQTPLSSGVKLIDCYSSELRFFCFQIDQRPLRMSSISKGVQ